MNDDAAEDRAPADAKSVLDEQRLRRLLAVGRSLVSELTVDGVLGQVLAVARDLTGATYAAVGVLDPTGSQLERFVTAGIDEATRNTIGTLPRGRGVLGVLIEHPQPLRLDDVGEHPRSYGFPPGHPRMTTFLGVPIRIRGKVYGNLYLTDKRDGAFSRADEEAIGVLADWAAIAIDNARAYSREHQRRDELERVVATLEATLDISRALGGETELGRVLELIAKRARALVEARQVVILLVDDDEQTLTVRTMAGETDRALIGRDVPVDGSISGEVLRTRRPQRLTDASARLRHALGSRIVADTGLLMPLVYRNRAVGVLAAFDRAGSQEFSEEDERLLESFALSAATAVATAQQVASEVLRRSIEASERERTRWARELHDETLQELAGLKVLLSSIRGEHDLVATAIEQIEHSITSLRYLITELRPAALDEYGLEAAVEALVNRVRDASGLAIETDIDLAWEQGRAATRHLIEIESTLYRLVQEALTNVSRHAGAENVAIVIHERESDVFAEIRDDGRGFDSGAERDGFGLLGMHERVQLVDGTVEIHSELGKGVIVRAHVPSKHRPPGPDGPRDIRSPAADIV